MDMKVRIDTLGNGTFRACCPSLPGCTAVGETKEEVWHKVTAAAQGYVASFDAATRLEFHEDEQRTIST